MTDTHQTTAPIDRCLDRWHAYLRSGDPAALDAVLAESCTFWSPVVFRPQQGKQLTTLYLTAAAGTLAGNQDGTHGGAGTGSTRAGTATGDEWDGRFRYTRTVVDGRDAVLEFETTMGGKYVNGVDMITCDDDGRIIDFKVMIRPLQAIEIVREQMRAMLDTLGTDRA